MEASGTPVRASCGPALTRRRFVTSLAAGTGLCLIGGCARKPRLDSVSAEALAIHRDSLVLDLHVDTLLWDRLVGYDPFVRHENRIPTRPLGFQMDLERAAEGGLDAAVMGLVINPVEVRDELIWPLKALAWWEGDEERGRGVAQALATLERMDAMAAERPDRFVFARSGTDILFAPEGRFAALAGLEGAHAIEGDLANVRTLYEHGLRMVGLVHFQATQAGYPMTVREFYGQGLTDFGRELIEELERLDIVVDLAHLNATGVFEAITLMRRPFVVSHTACQALHDHPRNLTDPQLELISRRGGVVGIAVGRSFIGGGGLDGFLRHVEHALEVAGPDAVALGSDYDGFIVPESGMGDVRVWPEVTQGLLDRGVDPETITKLLGRNALNVLIEVCG